MAITDKTRKILWARSGNSCAFCKVELIADGSHHSCPTVIGQECHIKSEKPQGPRFDFQYSADRVNSPENLILLCPNHHVLIDAHPDKYTVDKLVKMKNSHEQWIHKNRKDGESPEPIQIKRTKAGTPEYLVRLMNGSDVLAIVGGSHGYSFSSDEPASREKMEEIKSFLQSVQDWGELYDDIESGGRIEAAYEISRMMDDLDYLGFWVFGARETRVLVGGTSIPSNWNNAVLRVVRQENSTIIKVDLSEDKNGKEQPE